MEDNFWKIFVFLLFSFSWTTLNEIIDGLNQNINKLGKYSNGLEDIEFFDPFDSTLKVELKIFHRLLGL